jgi:nucleoid-associated protein YgaU
MAASKNGVIMTDSAKKAFAKASQLGLRFTSGYRTASEQRALGLSPTESHGLGLALDFAGEWSKMDAFAKWAKSSGLFSLVLWQVKGHYDHVHVAYKKDRVATPATSKDYIVVAGDNLSKIARKFDMTLSEIIKKNPQIENIDLIHPGDKIHVF